MAGMSMIDAALREVADSGRVPGVVAVASARDGFSYEGAFGKRALPNGEPMTVNSVFWIASMTKAITSTAAMQLVERGKLELDRPIGELLPELATPEVLEGWDAEGKPRLRRARRPITLRHLLTHTSGFVYDIWNADLHRWYEAHDLPRIASCREAALTIPLAFDPGERWDYGVGIDWVGKAVEKVSGQNLEDYFRESILDPLGMGDTSFRLTPPTRARLVTMHARQADGSLVPLEFELPQDPEFLMGGGGLYGTAPDYLRFAEMFLHGGTLDRATVLQPDTVRLMQQNHIGDIDVGLLKTANPGSSNDAEFFPGMKKKWGLGFMTNTEAVAGGRSADSLAWAGLGNTYFWIDPEHGVAGVLMTQLLPFADRTVLDMFARFETDIYAATKRELHHA